MELWFQVQGLLKLGQCRDDKMRRLTLKIDAADIIFALQVLIYSLSFNFCSPCYCFVSYKFIPTGCPFLSKLSSMILLK